jgi:hypothetical protein
VAWVGWITNLVVHGEIPRPGFHIGPAQPKMTRSGQRSCGRACRRSTCVKSRSQCPNNDIANLPCAFGHCADTRILEFARIEAALLPDHPRKELDRKSVMRRRLLQGTAILVWTGRLRGRRCWSLDG